MTCLAERRCTVTRLWMLEALCGSQMMLAYSKILVLCKLGVWFCVGMCEWRKAEVVFALCAVLLMWVFQFRVLWMWIPRYLMLCLLFGSCGCVWCRWIGWCYVCWWCACMVWHFCGWKCMSQSDSHHCRASRSSWKAFQSSWLVMGW